MRPLLAIAAAAALLAPMRARADVNDTDERMWFHGSCQCVLACGDGETFNAYMVRFKAPPDRDISTDTARNRCDAVGKRPLGIPAAKADISPRDLLMRLCRFGGDGQAPCRKANACDQREIHCGVDK